MRSPGTESGCADRDRVSGAIMTRCFKDKAPSWTGENRCECWVLVMFSLRSGAARTNLSARCIPHQLQWNPSTPVLSAPPDGAAKQLDGRRNQSVFDRKALFGQGRLMKTVLLAGAAKERGEYSQATVSVRGE